MNPYSADNRRLFAVYLYYRLGMSALLSVLFLSGLGSDFLGAQHPSLFIITSCIYLGICFISLLGQQLQILAAQASHVLFLLVIDFIALITMIYASNSSIGGLGYLLLIPMAVGSTFLRGKTSVALAAFASLLLLATNIPSILENSNANQTLFTSGITGTILFITAISFRLLSKKIQSSEYKIQQQTEIAYYLQKINQRIIETIQAGIIVIDNELTILLINNAAKNLLSTSTPFNTLSDIPVLNTALHGWKKTQKPSETMSINLGVNHNLKVSFTPLSDPNINSLMLFIEDERRINQEAQQLKLASLGRLTSSIAHEIRNPLGAISHASQLLDESEHIHGADQELLRMIQINSQRIDQTINNILQFSRRKEVNTKNINLCQWLTKFVINYQPHSRGNIILNTHKKNIYCKIDPNHLQQIISNLVDNGLRHSQKLGKENIITIETHIDNTTKLPYIDIMDEGGGINDDNIDAIFEPFFTTKPTGSGLGLYLCKELCQANQANILYLKKTPTQKSCFRLILCQSPLKKHREE
jgi:two-component system, NtrC family, sensor histidine kinase PilS